MNRIGIIICYFGQWPFWFPYFIESCNNNNNIDWLIFNDNMDISPKYPNIRFYKMNLNKFNQLAQQKICLEINIQTPYKLCDLKPLFGKIFEDYLLDYTFWGYGDIDVIFGQIKEFIPDKILQNYDIISTYKGFLSGPFCLFRNETKINELYKYSRNYPSILTAQKHFGFDENIQKKEIIRISLQEIINAILFTFQYLITSKCMNITLKEFIYQFQWFHKKHTLKKRSLSDMTDVVWFSNKKSDIRVHFKELMLSDRHFNRIKNKDWQLTWDNGNLFENTSKKKIMAFHFIDLKNDSSWRIQEYQDFNGKFSITKKGIRIE